MSGKNSTSRALVRRETIAGYAFMIPSLIFFLGFVIYPMIQCVITSFFDSTMNRADIFVGLGNYKELFQDKIFLGALVNTIIIVVVSVPVVCIFSLWVSSVIYDLKEPFCSIFRCIFYLPVVTGSVAVTVVWKWMFNQDYGLLNHLFNAKINWVTDPSIAMIAIVVVGVWSSLGNNMVLLLGGLQDIPRDYYEAASVDGSTGIHTFFHITIPLLSPMLFFIIQTGIMGALQLFDLPFMIMDQSSKAWPSVKTITYLFYEYAFERSDRGYGAAIIMLLICIISVITFILQKTEKKWVHYE